MWFSSDTSPTAGSGRTRRFGRPFSYLVGLLMLCLVAGSLLGLRVNPAVAALPVSATDETKVPHYFGPYPNWANSPQTLADAMVEISVGTPTPVLYGNPLTERQFATDYATAPGTMVKRAGSEPRRSQTSPTKDRPPMRSALAWASTAHMATRWVSQHEPSQWPSPPWIETTVGTPISLAASSVAQPVG